VKKVLRYVVSMTRVKRISVSYGVRDSSLLVVLRWE
jgi:hypothetical protein